MIKKPLWSGSTLLVVLGCLTVGRVACAETANEGCQRALRGGRLEVGVGFGGLRIGMSRSEVEGLIGPPERRMGDAWEYLSCGFALSFTTEGRLAALLGGGHPEINDRFTVRSAEGLGIGSTREELVEVFGEPSEVSSEGQMLHYSAQGMTWTLTEDRVTHVTIRRPRPAPEGARP